MSDEELSITEAAAQLSSHFMGCMPHPEKNQGGLIETKTDIRHFPSEESFDSAMQQHAFEGIEEAEISEYGLPVDEAAERRSKKKKSKYAEKKERRLAEERREKEEEKRREEERRRLRKENPVPPDPGRAEFLREEARRRVRELRSMQEQSSLIEEAVARAATPKESPSLPPRMRPVFDPERAFRRKLRSFGIHP